MKNYGISIYNYCMFKDRDEAGKKLAKVLKKFIPDDAVVLALPRGGVPVGYHIAQKYNLPFDVIISRKLGAPHQKEFAIGAISEMNSIYLDSSTIHELRIPDEVVEQIVDEELTEMNRRKNMYRNGRDLSSVEGKIVILVDDGLATGATVKAAVKALRRMEAEKIILAVPVSASSTRDELMTDVDELICLRVLEELQAIGHYYKDFSPTTDEEVISYLKEANIISK